jgi:hypothetical protein
MALDTFYRGSPGRFWLSLLLTNLAGWFMLWTACCQVARKWQHEEVTTLQSSSFFEIPSGGFLSKRDAARLQLDQNPMLWLSSRRTWQNKVTWPVFLFALAASVAKAIGTEGPIRSPQIFWVFLIYLSFAISIALKVFIASLSAQWLVEGRRSGMLPLLLITPFRVQEIIRGQRLALSRLLIWPVIITILAHGCLIWSSFRFSRIGTTISFGPGGTMEWGLYQLINSCGALLVFLADIYALSWVAMWLALSTKSLKHVTVKTVLYVIVLPGIAGIFVTPFLMSRLGWTSMLLTPAVLLIKDFLFTRWAKHKLNEEFRTSASQFYDSVPGSINWLDKFRRQSVIRLRPFRR